VSNAIAHYPHIEKVAFTGNNLVGRNILQVEAATKTNSKETTLELCGKSPNFISGLDDCDLPQALNCIRENYPC
jgi:aldehyde dehydrogenase (NAD+)